MRPGFAAMMPRVLEPEALDSLPADHPDAVRSRRDLQRVNRVLGTRAVFVDEMSRVVAALPRGRPVRVLELGSGDGSLMLAVANSVAASWPPVHLTLLDRQPVVTALTLAGFMSLGWHAEVASADVLEWAAAVASGSAEGSSGAGAAIAAAGAAGVVSVAGRAGGSGAAEAAASAAPGHDVPAAAARAASVRQTVAALLAEPSSATARPDMAPLTDAALAGAPPWDLIVANLFLHHFDRTQLRSLLAAVATCSSAFIACEPRRAPLPLLAGYLIGAIGVNAVTRSDAVLSVRAGFCGEEISVLWPDRVERVPADRIPADRTMADCPPADRTAADRTAADRASAERSPAKHSYADGWQVDEWEDGLFNHCFSAQRMGGAKPDLAADGAPPDAAV